MASDLGQPDAAAGTAAVDATLVAAGASTAAAKKLLGRSAAASWLPLAILVGLAGVQSFDFNAFGILAPDIRHTFHLSVAQITVISTFVVGTSFATIGASGFLPAYTTLVAFVAAPRLRAQAYGWSLLFYALGAITLQAGVIGPIINAYGQRWALVALGILVAAGGTVGISTRSFVDADMARAFSGD